MTQEIWKSMEVPYNEYFVSSLGRFKKRSGRILVTNARGSKSGNLSVNLTSSVDKTKSLVTARIVVAKYFLEGYYEGVGIRHLDRDRRNLSASNLQLYNKDEECEDTSKPTKKDLELLLTKPTAIGDIASKYNLLETYIYRLINRYNLRELFVDKSLYGNKEALVDCHKELWKSVREHPDVLAVSNHGRFLQKQLNRIVKGCMIRDSRYLTITIHGKVEIFNSARLVAEAFVPNKEGYSYIRHLDGNRNNCRADNLVWIPRADGLNIKKEIYTDVESSELVQQLLASIHKESITTFAKRTGNTMSAIFTDLRRFGFSDSRKEILEAMDKHREAGTLEQYVKGLTNIQYVELEEGEIKEPLTEFPGYHITSHGRVISYKTFRQERLLAFRNFGDETPVVTLTINNIGSTKLVKFLVANTFIPNPNNYTRVIHLDFDHHNCRVDNLAWVSKEEYAAYMKQKGELKDERGMETFRTSI